MLAIHTGSGLFVPAWLEYCSRHNVAYREVNCYASDIVEQLSGCSGLMWHWQHNDYRAAQFARQLTASLETAGIEVFPNTNTAWHFDDKVGQKYLLESVGAPLIPSHVFYDEDSAIGWLEKAQFPLVWKLKSGAGSRNVKLVHNLAQAKGIVRRSFKKGWRASRLHPLNERIWHFRRSPGIDSFLRISRGAVRSVIPHEKYRRQVVDKNYVLFQDFAPDNTFDIRVIVIGDRAFAIKRMVRDGDFRASGSGMIIHDPAEIPIECIELAFEVTQSIGSQCCAFDLVVNNGEWQIVEISYAFSVPGYTGCPGYWTSGLEWVAEEPQPEHFMIEDMLSRLQAPSNTVGCARP